MLDSAPSQPTRHPAKSTDFSRTPLEKHIGMKIPTTMQAILDSAWT
jgi:hypothetical protein